MHYLTLAQILKIQIAIFDYLTIEFFLIDIGLTLSFVVCHPIFQVASGRTEDFTFLK